ncbi:MAG TPA: alpha/beta hydrolase [Noviherbaspirillum sp.]|nr:alpha/beta hydrolase [Noviherbaspirillum sp.]
MMGETVLIMPGINNSGPEHWQTLWEMENPSFRRIEVGDWDHPQCADWIASVDRAVKAATAPVAIVAHSLGCLPVVEWALRTGAAGVRAAMLVSVPDVRGPNFPMQASGFEPVTLRRLPFRSMVVSSVNDPYGSHEYRRQCAEAWDSEFVSVGAAGHINARSGLGAWEEGKALLRRLTALEG